MNPRDLDKFYTKQDIADYVIKLIPHNLVEHTMVEPSAGGGAFLKEAFNIFQDVIALDLAPEQEGVVQNDWLDNKVSLPERFTLVGNPPFGKRNKLSKEFIRLGIERGATSVCMVLPLSYRKPTTQRVFPEYWKLVLDMDLPKNAFTLDGEDYDVPCCFQIWTAKDSDINLRWKDDEYLTHHHFEFCGKEDADAFVFGAAPWNVKHVSDVSQSNRGYYVKVNTYVMHFIANLKKVDWDKFRTSTAGGGVFWVTKQELIKAYSSVVDITK